MKLIFDLELNASIRLDQHLCGTRWEIGFNAFELRPQCYYVENDAVMVAFLGFYIIFPWFDFVKAEKKKKIKNKKNRRR